MGPERKGKKTLGARSEEAVCKLIIRKGFSILDRNYAIAIGEIDIIAEKDGTIYFIEVRSRSSPTDSGLIAASVSRRKQDKIFRVCQSFILKKNLVEKDINLILITVVWSEGDSPTFHTIPLY